MAHQDPECPVLRPARPSGWQISESSQPAWLSVVVSNAIPSFA
jgi:hypothetical protein